MKESFLNPNSKVTVESVDYSSEVPQTQSLAEFNQMMAGFGGVIAVSTETAEMKHSPRQGAILSMYNVLQELNGANRRTEAVHSLDLLINKLLVDRDIDSLIFLDGLMASGALLSASLQSDIKEHILTLRNENRIAQVDALMDSI